MSQTTDWKTAAKRTIRHQEFLIAVSDSNFEEMNRLIGEGVDINFQDKDGYTAMFVAIEHADSTVIQFLIDRGAKLDVENNDRETPLNVAKRVNRPDIVEMLDIAKNQDSQVASNGSIVSQNEPEKVKNTTQINKTNIWINPVHGNIYQLKVLMLFLYRGVACKYSFKLGTEVKEARKFDDLVFEYTQGNKKVYRLLQVKHKLDESKKITVDKLLSEANGDYSLLKYFQSFKACKTESFFKNGVIKDVIICTNIDFDFCNLKEANIEVCAVKDKDDILDIKSNEKLPMRYKFTKSLIPKLKLRLQNSKFGQECKISDDEVDDFLQHLVFAVNQPNEEELGNIVKNEISKEFDFITTENAYNKFFIQMLDWMKSRDRAVFWSYKDGKNLFEDVKKGMPVWYNVQDPIKLFIGRRKHLDDIHKLFQTKKQTMICVCGLGGVGKSELVKKYIAEYSQSYDNKVIWINAESYQTLVDSFRELACDKLGIKTKNADGEEKEICTLVAETYQYFSNGASLFVFDNSEMYKSRNKLDAGIDRFLPRLPNNCQKPYILITSRNQKWPKNVNVQVLEGFTDKEARLFITESLRLDHEEQKELVAELGKKLQLLPLALQQAVAYINTQNDKLTNVGSGFQISDYFVKLTERNKDIFNFEFSSDSENTYSQTVFTTWNVTLDAIKKKDNGKHALDILNITSYFLPDNIPIDILFIVKQDKEILASAIELLKQYSLINVQHKTLSMHRLVQQITRLKLDDNNEEKEILKMILKEIKKAHVNAKNVDHFLSLWSYCTKYIELVEEYNYVATRIIAEVLMCYYRFDEAKAVLAKVAESLQKLPRDNLSAKMALLCNKNSSACVLLKEGKYEIALRQFLELYEIEKVVYGSRSKEIASTMSNIGATFRKLNNNKEALKWCNEELRVERAIFGENHLETLLTKFHIATLLTEAKKYDEALHILEQTYNAYKMTVGENDLATIRTRSAIAVIYNEQRKYDKALRILQVTYNLNKQMLGECHPDTLGERIKIADVFAKQPNKHALALEIYEEVLKIKLKMIGENHPEVITLKKDIADVLYHCGESEKSLTILQDVLKKQRINLGSYHPDAFDTESRIATILHAQGKYLEALQLLEDLLNFKEEGSDDYKKTHVRKRIVDVLLRLERFDEALKHSLKVFEVYEKGFGKKHSATLDYKQQIAMIYYLKKDYKKAMEILTELQKIRRKEDDKNLYDVISQFMFENLTFAKEFSNNSRSTSKNPFDVIRNSDFPALKKLLEEGTDPNSQGQDGRTLLHIAAIGDNLEIVKFLIKNGADVTRMSNKGNTVLHVAALKNSIEIASAVLDVVSHVEFDKFINAKTKSTGKTALLVASENGFNDMIRLLLTRGAAYDIKNKSNKSALDVARDTVISGLLEEVDANFQLVKTGKGEVCKRFQKYFQQDFLMFINARNIDGYNLIQIAVMNNHKTLVYQFEKLKTDILRCCKPTFNSHLDELLSLAVKVLVDSCSMKTTLKLVEAFRTYDKRILDPNILAIEDILKLLKSMKNVVEPLMELVNVVIDTHVKLFAVSICTAKLLIASRCNDLTLVTQYIEQDAYVNVADDGGWTPLLHAVNAGNEKMTELLLKHGAQVDCATKTGKNTPLHIAVNKGHLEIVEMLLQQNRTKSFVNAKTEAKGSTALHIASKNGCLDIILSLLMNGATYCLKNKDEKMPVDLVEDDSIKKFFELIDEMFDRIAKGSREVLHKFRALVPSKAFAVLSACNDEEYVLADFALVKGHKDLSKTLNQIRNFIENFVISVKVDE